MHKRYCLSCFLVISFCCACFSVCAQLPAFPGAEGFGKYASGGRGGKLAAVTNLNDNGEGSFRFALEQYPDEPLTVIFRVSGIISAC